jgi:hypothetical protein
LRPWLRPCYTLAQFGDACRRQNAAKPLVYRRCRTIRAIYERTIRGSADVVPEESALKHALTGGHSPPSRSANHTRSRIIAADFVSDSTAFHQGLRRAARQVLQDRRPGWRGSIDETPAWTSTPRPLYVADATAKAVYVFDKDGKYLRKIAGPKFFDARRA